MSYVRTTKGRIAEVKKNMLVKETAFKQRFLVYKDCPEIDVVDSDSGLGEVTKEADDVKDLCDEFIAVLNDGTHIKLWSADELRRLAASKPESLRAVYGAIWIKGERGEPILKSAAKMNKGGKWELL